jgi:hypothetical protein
MRYFASASSPATITAMQAGLLGAMETPKSGSKYASAGVDWAADTGCFSRGYPGDMTWWRWLANHYDRDRCAFATAPDVVGNARVTLRRSAPWLPRIRELGIPAALVAQDGLEDLEVPWDTFDVLFLGGSTGWKLARHARALTVEAKSRGKSVHMGRVNTRRRLWIAHNFGCDSADGTMLAYGPDKNLPLLLKWLREINTYEERSL